MIDEPPGPALADAGPKARPRRGAPLISDLSIVWDMVERRFNVLALEY